MSIKLLLIESPADFAEKRRFLFFVCENLRYLLDMFFANKKFKLALILFSILIFAGCSTVSTKKPEVARENESHFSITGNWVNASFIQLAAEHLDSNILNNTNNYYCTELVISNYNCDSVLFISAFEAWFLRPVKPSENKLWFKNFAQDKGGVLEFLSDSTLLLSDSSETDKKTNKPYTQLFRKVKLAKNEQYTFPRMLNAGTLAGSYLSATKKNTDTIIFHPDGTIEGLQEFDRYEICYGGDCTSSLEEFNRMSICTLFSKDKEDCYAWRIDKQTGILSIYELSKGVPDIKGQLTIEKKIFELKKVK